MLVLTKCKTLNVQVYEKIFRLGRLFFTAWNTLELYWYIRQVQFSSFWLQLDRFLQFCQQYYSFSIWLFFDYLRPNPYSLLTIPSHQTFLEVINDCW